jgi:hypothetical protein
LFNYLVDLADNLNIVIGVMKECLSTRENVKSKNLNFLRMISLDVEIWLIHYHLCDLEMEISETSICDYLSLEIIDVEIDIKQNIIDFFFTTGFARVIGSEVLLKLSLKTFDCLILSRDTNIIEVVRRIWTPEVFNVEHGD